MKKSQQPNNGYPAAPPASQGGPTLDSAALIAVLFDKVAAAQLARWQQQLLGDVPGAEEDLLRLRGAALMLASIAAPTMEAMRHKVLAAEVVRMEDVEASHASFMIETAITTDMYRLQGPPLTGRF